VVLLLGVMSAVILSRGTGSNARLMGETGKLRTHLRFAQSLGLANNIDHWALAIRADGYGLQRNGATASLRLPGIAEAVYTFPEGIGVTEGATTITFDEWGSAGSSTLLITLSDGTYSSTITIEAETGHQS
jgi:hypothetical protein